MSTLTHERILDEALEMIVHEGVRRFSASELARRLGVVKSALYYHFGRGKADIVDQVFLREETRILEEMAGAVAAAGDTRSRLLAIASVRVGRTADLGRLFRVREEVADEVIGYPLERRRSFLDRERQLLEAVISRGVSAGEVAEIECDLAAAALQAVLNTLSRTSAVDVAVAPERAVARFVEMLFDGIGGRR